MSFHTPSYPFLVTHVLLGYVARNVVSHTPFPDGYCSTVQGLLDWFEVDLGFTELLFIQIGLCVMCVLVGYVTRNVVSHNPCVRSYTWVTSHVCIYEVYAYMGHVYAYMGHSIVVYVCIDMCICICIYARQKRTDLLSCG